MFEQVDVNPGFGGDLVNVASGNTMDAVRIYRNCYLGQMRGDGWSKPAAITPQTLICGDDCQGLSEH